MAKIYNEIVIDMNPESPTFEETLYEDSFEYNGDMMLAQGDTDAHEGERATIGSGKQKYYDPDGNEINRNQYMSNKNQGGYKVVREWTIATYTNGQWVQSEEKETTEGLFSKPPEGIKNYASIADAPKYVQGESTEWGAANITKDMFIDAEGNKKTIQQIYATLDPLLPNLTGDALKNQINKMLPQYMGATDEEKGFVTGRADIRREELGTDLALDERTRHLDLQKAGDVYELGMSAAGRAESAAGRAAGAATEQYGLGVSAAKRGLKGELGQLQAGAGQAGAQMRGAYGGMGGGMRGAIGAQSSMAKGLEQTYGAYGDKQTALAGQLGRAKGAHTDEMGRIGDERTRLEQEKGYATTQAGTDYLRSKATFQAGMGRADLAEEEGLYGLEQQATRDFESAVGEGFEDSWFETPAGGAQVTPFKRGGRVPSKKTFLDVLSKIPDAKGS